jgi:hypothetical protein
VAPTDGGARPFWPRRLVTAVVAALLTTAGAAAVGWLFDDPLSWSGSAVLVGVLVVLFATEHWWGPPIRRLFGTGNEGQPRR